MEGSIIQLHLWNTKSSFEKYTDGLARVNASRSVYCFFGFAIDISRGSAGFFDWLDSGASICMTCGRFWFLDETGGFREFNAVVKLGLPDSWNFQFLSSTVYFFFWDFFYTITFVYPGFPRSFVFELHASFICRFILTILKHRLLEI